MQLLLLGVAFTPDLNSAANRSCCVLSTPAANYVARECNPSIGLPPNRGKGLSTISVRPHSRARVDGSRSMEREYRHARSVAELEPSEIPAMWQHGDTRVAHAKKVQPASVEDREHLARAGAPRTRDALSHRAAVLGSGRNSRRARDFKSASPSCGQPLNLPTEGAADCSPAPEATSAHASRPARSMGRQAGRGCDGPSGPSLMGSVAYRRHSRKWHEWGSSDACWLTSAGSATRCLTLS